MSERKVLGRRKLLALGGAMAATPLAATASGRHDPYSLRPPKPVPGAESWKRFQERHVVTACGQCPSGCGISVRVVEGRAVKIAGQATNPINEGGIGPRGLAGLQVLYDPDRIAQPLRRKGTRGAGQWEAISWEEAIGALSRRLQTLRDEQRTHQLGVVCGRERGMMLELWSRFARTFGTPNFFDGSSRGAGAVMEAVRLTQGVREQPAYDWNATRYVVSFGAGLLEDACQTMYFSRAAAHLRRGHSGFRAKIVQFEPSRSRTAVHADEWVRIEPGSYTAVALGLAHVLVREGLHDRSFVADHCFGFESWLDEDGREHPGFRELIEAYSPEEVEKLSGVPARTLERIAREMGRERPAFAITDHRATLSTNGLQVALAVQALNAVLGSLERPGGLLVQRPPPLASWPEEQIDGVARNGLSKPRVDGAGRTRFPSARASVDALPEALAQSPDALDTVLLYYANPAYAGVQPQRWREALERVPFVVSFSPFMDETAALADLILPDHTYLERWEDAAAAPSVGYPVFGIRAPVVVPQRDTRATGDVVIEVARSLGGDLEASFPWENFEEALFVRVDGLQKAGRGSIRKKNAKAFRKALLETGHWSDPQQRYEDWGAAFRTPSGKFEFASRQLRREVAAVAKVRGVEPEALLEEWGEEPDLGRVCLPRHRPLALAGDAAQFPLVLEPYKPGTYAEGSGANLPLLQELVTEPGLERWKTVVELAPETARELGIRDRDRVEVTSAAGSVTAIARLRPGVHPSVVRIARGGGHTEFGRWAKGRGVNAMALTVAALEPLAGLSSHLGTRVRVRRVS